MKNINISTPTKQQLKHDAWVIFVAFVSAALLSWQTNSFKLTKDAAIAASVAGVAAVITVLKSIVTTV